MPNRLITLLLLMAFVSPLVQADAERRASRERELLRRVQGQLQQAQTQLGTLEQEKARLAQSLSEAEKARNAVQGRVARLNREVAQERQQREALQKDLDLARQELAQLRTQLAQERERLAGTQGSLAETQARLRDTEAERQGLERAKARLERELAASEERNRALYALGRELMVRFENKTCGEILAEKEPFTGLRRVQTENLLEYYRDKLDEHKLIKPPGG